jgi:hypothetical protein
MKPHWRVPILAAAVALSMVACAVAPDKVEPANVPVANYVAMDCGQLRYTLYKAEARAGNAGRNPHLRGIEGQSEDVARTLSAEPWRIGAIALLWPMAIAYNMYTPLFIAADQQSAVAALSQAKGEVESLRRTLDARGCTKWSPGPGSEIARFPCAFKDFDSRIRDHSDEIPNALTSEHVALIVYERAIAYPIEPDEQTPAWRITAGEIVDVEHSTPPDSHGRLTIMARTDAGNLEMNYWDVFDLRADDCSPLPAADIARANALFRDWFASLAR